MSEVVAAAVSGGIDSLAAAFLLKERGFRVIGLHFVTGWEPDLPTSDGSRAAKRAVDSAARKMESVSRQLDIPVRVLDLSREFNSRVIDYFVRTWHSGRTPNPCLVCNPGIKFGALLERARQMGADRLATGHYARVVRGEDGAFRLLKGADRSKDQSYFLAFMDQKRLAGARFPLGETTKSQVQAMAKEKGLSPVSRGESQDMCFSRGMSCGEFLAGRFPPKPGDIVDGRGEILGRHGGLHLFTVGQRRGINCPASEPYYVVRIDAKRNRLVVGFSDELFADRCRVESVNSIRGRPLGPFRAKTRVRYRHREADSTVSPVGDDAAEVEFDQPQKALAPGQGAVFYLDDELAGGGWIA